MKYFLFLSLSAMVLAGCGNTAPLQATGQPANQPVGQTTPAGKRDELSAISHSADNRFQPTNIPINDNSAPNPATGGNSPMARAIDVTAMNADIQKAEKKFEKEPKDAQAKKDLAHAYFVRAFALTEAAQYRAALGDFRKGLKLDPDDEDAKNMHDQIISIFKSIEREPPKEGEEPPPMPFGN
jgi:tetratricopeptide (TPR) repeat protein